MMQKKDHSKRSPSSLIAGIEAKKRTVESLKAAMRSSQQVAEVMKRKHYSVGHLRTFASPAAQFNEMVKRIGQQHMYADMVRAHKNAAILEYTSGIKSFLNELKLSSPISETMKQWGKACDTARIFRSVIEEQREFARSIAETLKLSFQVQKNIAFDFSRINDWQSAFRSIADSLKDFRPAVEVLENALRVEEEQFSQEDINQIVAEYIGDKNSDKNIFRQDGRYLHWEKIPKPVRWLIALIIATIFTIYFTAIWKEATKNSVLSPERLARSLIHFRKQEVRQINKKHHGNTCTPFVNTEDLFVYVTPKRRSQAIAVLSYPCEVKMLRFKNKKRWALIEWQSDCGEICQGWSLARYIYKKNIQKDHGIMFHDEFQSDKR